MRAFMLEVPQSLAEERRRTGADRWDEMWDGVLHMVPAPSGFHQLLASDLLHVLKPLARALGLECIHETDVHRPGKVGTDYRRPDLLLAPLSAISKEGIVGAPAFVVEVLSPNDESYDKLPFYAELGVAEALYVTPETRAVELYVLRGGRLLPMTPDASGAVRSAVLGVTFETVPGPKLKLSWKGASAEV